MLNEREKNIELLRVITMLLIITTHFCGHGIDMASQKIFNFQISFLWFMKGISYIGVDLYVLIGGYFLVLQPFKINRIIKLQLEVEFYSIVLFIVSILFGIQKFKFLLLIKALFPIITGEYWFVTIYFGLLILSPIYNYLISHLNKKQYEILILILVIFFTVIPNLVFFSKWLNFGSGYGIVWFTVLYFIGGYIQLHVDKVIIKEKENWIFILSVLFLIILGFSKIILAEMLNIIIQRTTGSGIFLSNNSILVLPTAVLFFLMFLNFEIKNIFLKKIIQFLSTGNFAVYLIHDNPNIFKVLWKNIIGLNNNNLILIFFKSLFIIYITCILFDRIRMKLFMLLKFNFFENIKKKIDLNINELFMNTNGKRGGN